MYVLYFCKRRSYTLISDERVPSRAESTLLLPFLNKTAVNRLQ